MSSKLFINWVTIKPDPTWKRKKRKKKAEQVGLWGYVLTAYQQASRPSRAWRPVPTRLQASWHSQSVQIRTFYAPLGRSYTSTPLSYRLFGGYVFPRGATKGLGWRKMGLIFFLFFPNFMTRYLCELVWRWEERRHIKGNNSWAGVFSFSFFVGGDGW